MPIMDQKVTTQPVLGELDERGVKFATLRMRSPSLMRHIKSLQPGDFTTITLKRPGPPRSALSAAASRFRPAMACGSRSVFTADTQLGFLLAGKPAHRLAANCGCRESPGLGETVSPIRAENACCAGRTRATVRPGTVRA